MIKESRYLKKREKIRKRRSFFRIIRGILYISLIILSILSLLKFLETSPYFYIKDIRISGSMHYSDNVIIEAFNSPSSIKGSKNLLCPSSIPTILWVSSKCLNVTTKAGLVNL